MIIQQKTIRIAYNEATANSIINAQAAFNWDFHDCINQGTTNLILFFTYRDPVLFPKRVRILQGTATTISTLINNAFLAENPNHWECYKRIMPSTSRAILMFVRR